MVNLQNDMSTILTDILQSEKTIIHLGDSKNFLNIAYRLERTASIQYSSECNNFILWQYFNGRTWNSRLYFIVYPLINICPMLNK